MSDPDLNEFSEIVLAKWTDRFFAWLIDFVVVSTALYLTVSILFGMTYSVFEVKDLWTDSPQYILTSGIFFIYWVVLEYTTGQTAEKKVLNLKTVSVYGTKPGLDKILIGSFGKSFFIPFDFVLGLILTNEKRQRVFNKLGDTIVIKIQETDQRASNIEYTKDC